MSHQPNGMYASYREQHPLSGLGGAPFPLNSWKNALGFGAVVFLLFTLSVGDGK